MPNDRDEIIRTVYELEKGRASLYQQSENPAFDTAEWYDIMDGVEPGDGESSNADDFNWSDHERLVKMFEAGETSWDEQTIKTYCDVIFESIELVYQLQWHQRKLYALENRTVDIVNIRSLEIIRSRLYQEAATLLKVDGSAELRLRNGTGLSREDLVLNLDKFNWADHCELEKLFVAGEQFWKQETIGVYRNVITKSTELIEDLKNVE